MRKMTAGIKVFAVCLGITELLSVHAFAGTRLTVLGQNAAGKPVCGFTDESGAPVKNEWRWIDFDEDGLAACYYFGSDGVMAEDTVIDGSYVNFKGQWVDAQTKEVQYQQVGEVRLPDFSGTYYYRKDSTYVKLQRTGNNCIVTRSYGVPQVSAVTRSSLCDNTYLLDDDTAVEYDPCLGDWYVWHQYNAFPVEYYKKQETSSPEGNK